MARVRTARTADLDAATLRAVRDLLEDAFGDLDDSDWEHCLGGVHALAWEGPALVTHGAVVQRRLVHGGRALRAGYVEGVGVRADRRRRGYGAAVMGALEAVVRGADDLGALSTTEQGLGLCTGRGWVVWRGPTSVLTPSGARRTPEDDGSVLVLPLAVPLDLAGEVTCNWRDGDVW